MPTQTNIENTLLSARYQMAVLCTNNLNLIKVGNNNVLWAAARNYNRNIKALSFLYDIEDYTSSTAISLYNCLNKQIGIDTTVNTIDPNYQAPNTTIIINAGSGNVSSEPIYFTNQTVVTITSYQAVYAPLFGNNPVLQLYIAVGDGSYAQDVSTAPIITYVVSGDPTSGISTISWGFGIPTSGYIQILGTP